MGPVVTGTDVRIAAQAALQKWMPSALAELGRRINATRDPDLVIAQPRTWTRLPDEELLAMRADQSPMIAVVSAGLAGEPDKQSDGVHNARWLIGAYVVVRGTSYEEVADLVGLYVAAARVAWAQHRLELAGAAKPIWKGESYRELDSDSARSIGAGLARFEVKVADVLDSNAGPAVPPAAPDYTFPDDPIAEKVIVSASKLNA